MIASGNPNTSSGAMALLRSLRPARAGSALMLMSIACLGGMATSVSAATYYVSPTGSDSNNGTSTSTPWQTITKVNAATFVAGDSVLFQGGQTFTGALIFSYGSNIPTSSAANPITVGSYGTGAAKILSSTTGSYSSAIKVNGINGLTIQGLTILGAGGTSPITWIGVYIINQSGSSKSGVTVNNCDISNFAGTTGAQSAEVYVNGYYGPLNTINITNNSLHGANGVGSPDCNGIYGLGSGQNVTNVTYSGNTVYNLGGNAANTGGGIVANCVNGGVLQYNIVHDVGGNATSCGGPGGVWAYNSNNITIQFNEVYNMRPITYTTGCDWVAYDLDGGVSNSVVQYNYSHNNFGGALLAYVATVGGHVWGNNTFRYNISENDALGAGSANQAAISITASPTNPLKIYGNTIYMGMKNSTGLSSAMQSNNAVAITLPAGSIIENNIFHMVPQSSGGQTYNQYMYFPYGLSGGTINNNIFYGGATNQRWRIGGTNHTSLTAYQTATGYDSLSLNANPMLANPGGGGTLSWTPSAQTGPQPAPAAYLLSIGSPATNAGATITDATRDYYGNAVPGGAGYDIGAARSTITTVVNFSNLSVGDYSSVPSTYQPITGTTITWTTAKRYGTYTYDCAQDHTQAGNGSAPSIDVGTPTGGTGASNSMTLDFSQPVTIPSIWVTNWDWWQQDVVLMGYTNVTDITPVITVTVPYTSIPSHSTGNVTGAWINVTGLAGVPIRSLDVIGTKNSSNSQIGGAVIDDITVLSH